jgi:hypothetical protein
MTKEELEKKILEWNQECFKVEREYNIQLMNSQLLGADFKRRWFDLMIQYDAKLKEEE